MNECRRIQDLIGPYVYDELSERERRAVENHLRVCEACRAEAEALRALVARLPTAPAEAPLGAEQRVLRGVQQRLAATQPLFPGALRPVLLAAAALALGVWIGSRLPRTGTSPAPAAPPRVQPAPVEARTAELKPAVTRAEAQERPAPAPRPQKVSAPKPSLGAGRRPPAAPPAPEPPDAVEPTAPLADEAVYAGMTPAPGPGAVDVHQVMLAPRPVGGDDVQVAEVVQTETIQ